MELLGASEEEIFIKNVSKNTILGEVEEDKKFKNSQIFKAD